MEKYKGGIYRLTSKIFGGGGVRSGGAGKYRVSVPRKQFSDAKDAQREMYLEGYDSMARHIKKAIKPKIKYENGKPKLKIDPPLTTKQYVDLADEAGQSSSGSRASDWHSKKKYFTNLKKSFFGKEIKNSGGDRPEINKYLKDLLKIKIKYKQKMRDLDKNQ